MNGPVSIPTVSKRERRGAAELEELRAELADTTWLTVLQAPGSRKPPHDRPRTVRVAAPHWAG